MHGLELNEKKKHEIREMLVLDPVRQIIQEGRIRWFAVEIGQR